MYIIKLVRRFSGEIGAGDIYYTAIVFYFFNADDTLSSFYQYIQMNNRQNEATFLSSADFRRSYRSSSVASRDLLPYTIILFPSPIFSLSLSLPQSAGYKRHCARLISRGREI